MAEARGLLSTAGGSTLGPYRVEAAIAALHASAPDSDSTPWPRIAELYAVLDRLAPSPVVTVNLAVAVGRSEGAQAGLDTLAPVLASGVLDAYVPLHAAHADLLQRSGQSEPARAAWRQAAALAGNTAIGRGLLRAAEETL